MLCEVPLSVRSRPDRTLPVLGARLSPATTHLLTSLQNTGTGAAPGEGDTETEEEELSVRTLYPSPIHAWLAVVKLPLQAAS